MWYVLPQLRGLGTSGMSHTYGIVSLEEAKAYLAHPILGARLRQCVAAIGQHRGVKIERILGDIDALKYRSCLTLFKAADDSSAVFSQALRDFFDGQDDPATLALLARQPDFSREA
jgi:uncharacterized protein (DUF1810 family)